MIRIYLSRLLGEHRWTQKHFADKTGIRPNTVNLYYHEMIDRINIEHLDVMCKVLDCKLSDIIEYVPDK
jgi:Predicted transcriptional regulator